MRVSVILPFYNAASTLQRAIQSILDQTFPDFELILIDNNSTDGSIVIASDSLIDDRVILIQESRQGVTHAANRGFKQGKGELFARMDSDDWSYPNRLESQVELLHANASIDLVSGLVDYSDNNPKEGFLKYLKWINGITDPDEIYLNQFVEYPIVNPSIMFRRELIEKYGTYGRGDFPEDYEFFLRLQQGGVRMMKVKTSVIKWNDLPNRLTRIHPNYTEEAFDRIKAIYLAEWLGEHNLFHPNIWVWGAGRKARKRSTLLVDKGIKIQGFIDLGLKVRSGDLQVINYEQLPDKPDRFIVSYVANWGSRQEIREFLITRGWKEGADFILAA